MIIINNDRYLKQTISFLSAAFFTVIILFCLSFIKNELDFAAIAAKYNLNLFDFVAEKSEKYQYMIGTAVFPVFFILTQLCLKNRPLRNPQKYDSLTAWSGFITVILIAVYVIFKVPVSIFLLSFIPNENTDMKTISVYLAVFVFAMIALFGAIQFYSKLINAAEHSIRKNNTKKKIFDVIIYIIAAANLLFLFYLYITKTYYFNYGSSGWHFDAYFYPVYRVYCGQTPLIDFESLYGFYPYFLAPLLKLTGGVSMLRFSVIMASLLVIELLALTIVVFRFCKNKVLALTGTLAVSFIIAVCPMLLRIIIQLDPVKYDQQLYYLQYTPHRVLFPALILLVCSLIPSMKNIKAKRAMVITGYILSALSLLWNIDTGIIVLLAFTMSQIYMLLLKFSLSEKKLYFAAFKILLGAVFSLLTAFLILLLITYYRTGQILDISSIFYSQSSFYGVGYYMLRMPLWSPWLLLVTLYAVFLARALTQMKFLRDAGSAVNNEQSVLYFVIPVIGMGIFSYYQGRSHFLVFLAVMWPGILMAVMLMNEYWSKPDSENVDKKRFLDVNKLKTMCITLLIASFAVNYFMHAVIPSELQVAKDKLHKVESSEISTLLNLFEAENADNRDIDLVTNYSAAVYCIMGETAVANIPATVDWFTKDDYQKVFNYLLATDNKVIIDEYSMGLMEKYEHEKINNVLTRFQLIKEVDGYRVYTPISQIP